MIDKSLVEFSLEMLPFHRGADEKCTVQHISENGRVAYTYTSNGFVTYHGRAKVSKRNGKFIVSKRLENGQTQQRTVQQ